MLIRRVTAHAFGPLVGQTLDFAERMTIVYGGNESAKSSWHAAVYAAACGRRRGAGRSGDKRFVELHRPWDGQEWVVSAEILLDDGRRIEMRQDLDGRVDCHAKDLDLGRDYSAEIMFEGSPDASRWLGLDRRSFLATACIEQAQLLAVLDQADGLQEHLQRAAATAGADETAAAALDRLDAYRREHVGTEQVNAVRPLRRAIDAARRARERLDAAQAAHADVQRRIAEARGLRAEGDAAALAVRRHEAALAAAVAAELSNRLAAAVELDRRTGGVEPPSAAVEAENERRVAEALSAWASLPTLDAGPPGSGSGTDPAAGPLDAEELRDLARTLATGVAPSGSPSDGAEAAAADAAVVAVRGRVDALVARRGRRRRWLLAAAAVVLLAGAGLLALGRPAVGGLAVAIGAPALAVGLALLAAAALGGGGGALAAARAALTQAGTDQAALRRVAQLAASQRSAAVARCAELGVPADPAALRSLAAGLAESTVRARNDERWRNQVREATARAQRMVLVAVGSVGVDANIDANTAEAGVAALVRWQEARADENARLDQLRRDWTELQRRLDGRTLPELRGQATAAHAAAAAARTGVADDDVEAAITGEALPDLREAARRAAARAAAAEGSLAEREAGVAPVGEAEEELVRAEEELARVRRLQETLDLTQRYLMAAQERVHRDIAPVLAATVRAWLPEVTGGRYTDVVVDPQTLRVEVCGPARRWRVADRLSYGTAEQIYLLLRVALAGHLVDDKVSCPLLLDDVTVHADSGRMTALLDLLLRESEFRQVIVFSQQEQVRDWARVNLTSPPHRLQELTPCEAV